MSAFTTEKVISVDHYTDRLFRFRTTRPQSLRFRSGEFVMIGLAGEAKPILRAYSIASPSWDEELEFFSIKVEDGPLTSKLQKIQPGDELLIGKKPTGTLVLDALTPGKRLYMFSTGTGFAPFASLVREPETYEKFDEVIVTHTCRQCAELQYSMDIVASLPDDPLVGEEAPSKLRYVSSCTREEHPLKGRITALIDNGGLFEHLGVPKLNPETDRVMICGSMEMIQDTKQRCIDAGMTEGSNAQPAQFVVEKSFVG
ncbi:ferredoxin--NADP reductase [Parvularcula sp. LCG005]|uniref:ferredoxin--NADP reductase n=1 Tax=Parvularcula sp. LCG005 TaxID=3078805 RepID=UPI002942A295|nr:ferredoxin--NADP reductase [Parvularcula sp. LCG005]WOI52267.1 ferredoxin--NADP reductase [Parvularcula sp. LCG005]